MVQMLTYCRVFLLIVLYGYCLYQIGMMGQVYQIGQLKLYCRNYKQMIYFGGIFQQRRDENFFLNSLIDVHYIQKRFSYHDHWVTQETHNVSIQNSVSLNDVCATLFDKNIYIRYNRKYVQILFSWKMQKQIMMILVASAFTVRTSDSFVRLGPHGRPEGPFSSTRNHSSLKQK